MLRKVNRQFVKLLLDAAAAGLCFPLALYIRMGDVALLHTGMMAFHGTWMAECLALPIFATMHLHKSIWRYASITDLLRITQASIIFILLFYFGVFALNRLETIPRSVPFIHLLLTIAMLSLPRVVYRLWHQRQRYVQFALQSKGRVPVLVVGTTARADLFIRETISRPYTPYRVVGILDQSLGSDGQTIHGIPVYAPLSSFSDVVGVLSRSGMRPQKIVVADSTLKGEELGKLVKNADAQGIPVARMPWQMELHQGMEEPLNVKPIAIEDLLGRAQQVHDRSAMRIFIEGKTVLITGAGGTIGGELARQVAEFKPSKLILFELSEFHLYKIRHELDSYGIPCTAIIGDVRDIAALDKAFSEHKPQVVFHAAAIKHVPIAEENTSEAVLTNVRGTRQVKEACEKYAVSSMVLISTDKAVNPTNVMGATKRVAEKLCWDDKSKTRLVVVRFGNVLGSTGSVVPMFQEQIARGGPVTITHQDMERYFMTVREAVELVMQAASSDEAGTSVLDMGTPMNITKLAEQMIELSGFKPYQDIPIIFTGLRKGEKLKEELSYSFERLVAGPHVGIHRVQTQTDNTSPTSNQLQELENAALERDNIRVKELLKKLLPEYVPT